MLFVIARWGWPLALALACGAAAAQFVDFGLFDLRLRWLDMATHASVFGVVSILALTAALALATLLALFNAGDRTLLALPCVLAIILALRVLHPPRVLLYAVPFGVAAFVLLWRLAPRTRGSGLVRAGCVALVLSYAIHAVGTTIVTELGYGPMSWPYQIKLVIKHSGELMGWTLVAAGLADLLEGRARLSRSAASRSSGARLLIRRVARSHRAT